MGQVLFILLLLVEFTFGELGLHAFDEGFKFFASPAQFIEELLVHFAAVELLLEATERKTGSPGRIFYFGIRRWRVFRRYTAGGGISSFVGRVLI